MKATLTTKNKKSKCLNYRNGKRCGRLGRYLVKSHRAAARQFKYPVCKECEAALIEQGAEIVSYSPKGYVVKESVFGPAAREYAPVEAICINCGEVSCGPVDRYCQICGPGQVDAEGLEATFLAWERACERG